MLLILVGVVPLYADEGSATHFETFDTVPALRYRIECDLLTLDSPSSDDRLVLSTDGQTEEVPLHGKVFEKGACTQVKKLSLGGRVIQVLQCAYDIHLRWEFFAVAPKTTVSFKLVDSKRRTQNILGLNLMQVVESSHYVQTFPTIPGREYQLGFGFTTSTEQQAGTLVVEVAGRTDELPLEATGPITLHSFETKFSAIAPDTTVAFSILRGERWYAPPAMTVDIEEEPKNYERLLSHVTDKKPTRLQVHLDQLSAEVGKSIGLLVLLATASSLDVVADKDYKILLKSSIGKVTPSEVTIKKGQQSAKAEVVSDKPGAGAIRASSPANSLEGDALAKWCATGTPTGVHLSTQRIRARADNKTPDLFVVDLVDDAGTLTKDKGSKSLDIKNTGRVGEFRPFNNHIVAGYCTSEHSLFSGEPGTANVTVRLFTMSQPQSAAFSFYQAVTPLLLLLALVGGVAGAFVKAVSGNQQSPPSWRWFGWFCQLASGALIGLCLSLAYHVGLLPSYPRMPGALWTSFVLGMLGGYGGAWVMDALLRISLGSQQTPSKAVDNL